MKFFNLFAKLLLHVKLHLFHRSSDAAAKEHTLA